MHIPNARARHWTSWLERRCHLHLHLESVRLLVKGCPYQHVFKWGGGIRIMVAKPLRHAVECIGVSSERWRGAGNVTCLVTGPLSITVRRSVGAGAYNALTPCKHICSQRPFQRQNAFKTTRRHTRIRCGRGATRTCICNARSRRLGIALRWHYTLMRWR